MFFHVFLEVKGLIAQVFIQLLIHVYHMTEKIMSAFTMQYKLKITDKLAALNQSIWSNFLSYTWNKYLNICLWQPYSPFWRSKLNGTEFILLHAIKGETFLWKLNLSLRHLTATSSLERQNIQIFLFRSLFLQVSFGNIQDFTLPTRTLSQLLGIKSTMLPLRVAWTTTQCFKRHEGALVRANIYNIYTLFAI